VLLRADITPAARLFLALLALLPLQLKAKPDFSASTVTCLASSDAVPSDAQQLRLRDLEKDAGLKTIIWEMHIAAGKKLILRISETSPDNYPHATHSSTDNSTYEITGPADPIFANRFSLTEKLVPVPGGSHIKQIFVEVGTERERSNCNVAQWIVPLAPGWGSGWGGGTPGNALVCTSDPFDLYREFQGPGIGSHQYTLKISVSVAPADPGAKPASLHVVR
jgi:hypothetical protein